MGNKIVLFLIHLYQLTISPDKGIFSPRLRGRICPHTPHCSEYAKQCFHRYPFRQALDLTADRVMTCTPATSITTDPSAYRVVFFSGAPIGVPFLTALHDDPRYDLVGVVTMPDAPSGRGMNIKENVIKQTAKKLGIHDIQTPPSLRLTSKKYADEAKQFHTRLTDLAPDYIVVVAYGKIIPQSILDIPTIGPINVHGSLLPAYRGASPLQSAFLHGETESGVTVMRMNAQLDEGDMIATLKTKLPLSRTVKHLITWIETHSPTHLLDTLRAYAKGDLKDIPQDDTKATLCTKITKEDGLVDIYTDTLEHIYQKYQAYALRPKIYFIHNKKRVIIEQIELDEQQYETSKNNSLVTNSPLIKGEDEFTSQGDLHETYPTGNLNPAILKCIVKPEGKKSISRADFEKGYLQK